MTQHTTQPTTKETLMGLLVLILLFGGGCSALYHLTRPKLVEYSPQLQACLDAIPTNTPPGASKAYRSNCHSKYGR